MGQQRGILTIFLLISLITLPTMMSLTYYQITKDPNIRPLGITRESLRAYGEAGGIGIVANVAWDPGRSGRVTRDDMETALTNAFRGRGMEVWVIFEDSRAGTHVTYNIGASSIGPYPQSRAAEGISAAVAAYRMHVPYKP